ncbi:substrate-binding domain-containing protein [Ohessyouella blattaphilus]|uniref:Substrate-binding domain-containing protein n=1 Tax=Ohessyouella blattaphilus TaxID=2949333 RepID=A0ABT1EFI7_9FIRM|nr:substrate-binding domain-containing protein [Ohessyouella blattaphilus]MCP1109475.1 substrate-binding domain-containing protein [Ohessyouella blattaphilus]MCR8562869.1 substrate-binding domain-containing protein [Ohessyouella blattaphilus]
MSKLKKIMAILLLLTLATSIWSCKKSVGTDEDNAVVKEEEPQEEEAEAPKIGFSVISLDNPFYKALESSIQEEMTKAGYEFIVKDPAGSVDTQAAQIEEFIAQEIDILILTPVNYESITPSLELLKKAKIKVVGVDVKVKEESYLEAFIGSDNEEIGRLLADAVIEKLPEGGKIAVFECFSQSAMAYRMSNLEEGLAGAKKGFEVVKRIDGGSNYEESLEKARELLASRSDIDAIICGNDQMAMGVKTAANLVGNESVLIFGIDGAPEIKQEIAKSGSQVVATVAQSPITMGKSTFSVVKSILEKEDYEKEIKEKVYLVDRTNIDVYGTDGWQ